MTLERAPLLNLVLSLSFFLSLDINLINSSVHFPYVFLITRDRSDHDLVDSSNNSDNLNGLKIKLLHELIHSLKRFLLIDRTSFSYYLRLLLSLFDSNDDLIKCGKNYNNKITICIDFERNFKKIE